MFENKSAQELLTIYCETLKELRRRSLTRSINNPAADFTETLVANALTLTLVKGSTTVYDATDEAGRRYEIKGRRLTRENKSRQMSFIRGLDMAHFDLLAGVLFDENFAVHRGCVIPRESVMRMAKYVKHVNGWKIYLRDSVWDGSDVRDITNELKRALSQM